MQVQDVVTYQQKITHNITDKEVAQYFYDKDYGILLTFLRTGPKTIKEIEEEYTEKGNEKSDKTIYRYIKTLEEAGLVVEGGKRIYTDEQHKNKSLSIYVRTAKVFIDQTEEMQAKDEKKKKAKDTYQTYKILLDYLDEDKTFTVECVEEILNRIYQEGQDRVSELIEKADDKLFELLKDHTFSDINDIMLNLAWIIMIYKEDFKKILTDC